MKTALFNYSGNVGKSTLGDHFLKPRMPGAKVFSVESINLGLTGDDMTVEQIRGTKFGELQEQLMVLDNAIIDVGSSNAEDFLSLMIQFHGSHMEFDYFVVPVTKEGKQQGDTVNTIRALAKAGVPKKKIRLVFNRVKPIESVKEEFAMLFGLHKLEKSFFIHEKAVIHESQLFERLKNANKTLGEVQADKTDYRSMLNGMPEGDERDRIIEMVSLQRLSHLANENMDEVFSILFD